MRFWGVKGANESVDGASGDFHSFYNNHVHINSGGCIRDALMGSLAKGVDAAEAPLRSADGLLVINVAGIVEAGDGFYQLGPYLSQFVNDCGLFIIWKMDNGGGGGEDIVSDDSSSVAPRDFPSLSVDDARMLLASARSCSNESSPVLSVEVSSFDKIISLPSSSTS